MEPTAMVCPGCNQRIEPIYIFDRSPKTKKPYLILRCPRERCGFNLDIQDYTGKPRGHSEDNKKGDGDGGKSNWRFGL